MMSLMYRCCFVRISGATCALAGLRWSLPNPVGEAKIQAKQENDEMDDGPLALKLMRSKDGIATTALRQAEGR